MPTSSSGLAEAIIGVDWYGAMSNDLIPPLRMEKIRASARVQ